MPKEVSRNKIAIIAVVIIGIILSAILAVIFSTPWFSDGAGRVLRSH